MLLAEPPEKSNDGKGARVGSGVAAMLDVAGTVLAWTGLGEWASIAHPIRKLTTLVRAIQKRSTSFMTFIGITATG